MDKVIEQLRKEALPIIPQCVGQNLTEEQQSLLNKKYPTCTRIEPVEIFEIIDEETGQVDNEVAPELSYVDASCRCKAYAFPAVKWKNGRCPLATHIEDKADGMESGKTRVGQQKQKKKR